MIGENCKLLCIILIMLGLGSYVTVTKYHLELEKEWTANQQECLDSNLVTIAAQKKSLGEYEAVFVVLCNEIEKLQANVDDLASQLCEAQKYIAKLEEFIDELTVPPAVLPDEEPIVAPVDPVQPEIVIEGKADE